MELLTVSEQLQLTPKQQKILLFIKKYSLKNGYVPTVREIGANMGLSSPATIQSHIDNIIKKGFLKRDEKYHKYKLPPAKPTYEFIKYCFKDSTKEELLNEIAYQVDRNIALKGSWDKEDSLKTYYKNKVQSAIEYIKSNEWAKDYKLSSCRTHLLDILGDEMDE